VGARRRSIFNIHNRRDIFKFYSYIISLDAYV